jgi:hypothetical protein
MPGFNSDDDSLIAFVSGSTIARMDNKGGNTKRKQTLLSLLDALNELTKDEDFVLGEFIILLFKS